MPAMNELARLKRDIHALVEAVNIDLRPTGKGAISSTDRRALRSEIEAAMRDLDELRARLSG